MMNISDITNFSTLSFFVFICCAFALYSLTPQKFRQLALLTVSYIFYASYQFYHIWILILTTVIDFYFAQIIFERRKLRKNIKPFVATCLSVNLGLLCYFKYHHLLVFNFNELTTQTLLFPLGLSFFTLQSVGYVLDVSRGKDGPEKNFITYALFVSFFPQIIAGPIEKASEIIPQYKNKFAFKSLEWGKIIYLFAYGFFKKYIVADNLALILSHVPITDASPLSLKYITLVYFLMRLYCDFSGYTDMARAIAKLFNINLTNNFNFPLYANSPQDYWDRWHMSLGRWIRNYFYLPLLLLLENPFYALLIVFPIMGLWHGAQLSLLVWGFLWALAIIISKKMNMKSLPKPLSTLLMFNLAALLMVFYKTKNYAELQSYFHFQMNTVPQPEHMTLLISYLLLPVTILVYEGWLFLRSDYYYMVKKNFYIQTMFYISLFAFCYYFSGAATQQVFYLQY